jgi:putative transposase
VGQNSVADRNEKWVSFQLPLTLAWWFEFYNNRRPHKTFDGRKPMEIYQQFKPEGVPPLACPRKAA